MADQEKVDMVTKILKLEQRIREYTTTVIKQGEYIDHLEGRIQELKRTLHNWEP